MRVQRVGGMEFMSLGGGEDLKRLISNFILNLVVLST